MSTKKELPSLRLLIVEDNTDIAENIADYLEVQGHVLDFAMDGIGGLHLALTQDYDAIILDVMLPVSVPVEPINAKTKNLGKRNRGMAFQASLTIVGFIPIEIPEDNINLCRLLQSVPGCFKK